MDKLNWGKRACSVFLLCATTAIALPAQTFTTLHSFDVTDGANPYAGLVQATDGNLYGTTVRWRGQRADGTVFKITPSGTLTTLYSFCSKGGCTDGAYPFAGLVQATDGNFYGTTSAGGATDRWHGLQNHPKRHADDAVQLLYKRLHGRRTTPSRGWSRPPMGTSTGQRSSGGANDLRHGLQNHPKWHADDAVQLLLAKRLHGRHHPYAGLVQATNGNFYGTTVGGGAHGGGTVFKITPSGTLTTLYSFCSQSGCTDGADPHAGLVQATNGNFYGTTYDWRGQRLWDGLQNHPKRHADDAAQLRRCTDGDDPVAGLIQATDGNFYGTTSEGGAHGDGTVFKITPSGTLTTLYSFCSKSGCTDGDYPDAGLVQDTNGTFYGTT